MYGIAKLQAGKHSRPEFFREFRTDGTCGWMHFGIKYIGAPKTSLTTTVCKMDVQGMRRVSSLFDGAMRVLCPDCTPILIQLAEQSDIDKESEYNEVS